MSNLASLLGCITLLSFQLSMLWTIAVSLERAELRVFLAIAQIPFFPLASFLGYKAFRSKTAAGVFSGVSALIAAGCVVVQ